MKVGELHLVLFPLLNRNSGCVPTSNEFRCRLQLQENLANLPMQPTKSSVLLASALLEKNMPRASSDVFSFWNAAWQRGQK